MHVSCMDRMDDKLSDHKISVACACSSPARVVVLLATFSLLSDIFYFCVTFFRTPVVCFALFSFFVFFFPFFFMVGVVFFRCVLVPRTLALRLLHLA